MGACGDEELKGIKRACGLTSLAQPEDTKFLASTASGDGLRHCGSGVLGTAIHDNADWESLHDVFLALYNIPRWKYSLGSLCSSV